MLFKEISTVNSYGTSEVNPTHIYITFILKYVVCLYALLCAIKG